LTSGATADSIIDRCGGNDQTNKKTNKQTSSLQRAEAAFLFCIQFNLCLLIEGFQFTSPCYTLNIFPKASLQCQNNKPPFSGDTNSGLFITFVSPEKRWLIMNKTIYQFHQGNMFCTMCLLNVANVFSEMRDVVTAYSIDTNKKTIRVELANNVLDEETLRTLIDRALANEAVSDTEIRILSIDADLSYSGHSAGLAYGA
jgi:hypothetical protein